MTESTELVVVDMLVAEILHVVSRVGAVAKDSCVVGLHFTAFENLVSVQEKVDAVSLF